MTEFPVCRGCGKPARYQGYTGRAYCGPECGSCWEEDRLQVPSTEDRKRVADREIAEWSEWVGTQDLGEYRANAENVIASWRRWAETGEP